jgi:signal recognition particle subunit SRP72
MSDDTTDEVAATTWQDSILELQSLLASTTVDRDTNLHISSICSTILNNNSSSNSNEDDDAPSESILPIVITIYLRALIQLGQYSKVVDYSNNSSSSSSIDKNNTQEVAYALYRLRKYDACRKLIMSSSDNNDNMTNVAADGDENDNSSSGSSSSNNRLMAHIHAQTLYRLGETNLADELYANLLLNNGGGSDNDDEEGVMDDDEREDTLSNALANRIANYTPGSMLQNDGTSKVSWLEQDESIRQLIQSYGEDNNSCGDDNDDEEMNMLQNYDLAYNLATYMLLSSDGRSQSQVVQAKRLLEHAEKSALTILDSTSPEEEEEDGEGEEEEGAPVDVDNDEKQQKMVLLAEREAGPIRANLALANILLGGEENEMAALRTYLTLLTKASKEAGAAAEQGNLLATVSNNLALLRDGKESVFDVLKRIPITSSLSVSEDVTSNGGKKKKGKGGSGGGGVSIVPLVGATPQQVRTALFNRALLLAKMGNTTGCTEALEVLRASLLVSYHGDNSTANKNIFGKKGKGKKKITPATEDDVPTARPCSDAEIAAWKAQADWLESELVRISESTDKNSADIIDSAIANLDKAINTSGSTDGLGALSYTKSQLLLHRAVLADADSAAPSIIDAIESLPLPVLSCPGTKVTLASLYGSSNDDAKAEQLLSDLGDDIALAEFRLERGQYQQAVELLESILDEQGSDAPMGVRAMLVKALSYTDPAQAEEVAQSLLNYIPVELDGEELESMEIPRFAKRTGDSSSKVRKTIAATGGGKGRMRVGERKKKNRDAVLRKRAKQREAYLSKLEADGRYDPKQSPQPDPERWIPKSQRSYNRRGRRGRNKGVGAQGGGAGAGMEKDAAKLDIAARAAGNNTFSSGPSTANVKVNSSGGVRKGKGGRRR